MNIIIDKDFEGGNIVVKSIDGFDVYVEQEIRDTTEWWFYFSFRAKALKEGTYYFHFCNREVISKFGPAISLDGDNYFFDESTFVDHATFKMFIKEGQTVYFAFSYPYQTKDFSRFFLRNPYLQSIEMKEKTNRGRSQFVYTFGNPNGAYFSLSARHHSCETCASYVLEGFIEQIHQTKLVDKYLFSVIPFVDLDGVIDGDQGKSRAPHDHNRDYLDKPIYSSIRYITNTYHNNLAYFLDFHCPGKWGGIHDYLSIIEGDETLSERQKQYSKILEKYQTKGIPYSQEHNIEYLAYWNLPSANGRSFFVKEKVKLGFTLEVPYFGEREKPYSIEELRELGRNMALAIVEFDDNLKL